MKFIKNFFKEAWQGFVDWFELSVIEDGIIITLFFSIIYLFYLIILLPFTPFIILNEWSKEWF